MKLSINKVADLMRIVTYVAVLITLPIIAGKALPLLDRAVTVLENLDERVEKAFRGAAPLGKAAVSEGISALRSVDTKQVGKDLNDAIRRKLQGKKK